MNCQLAGSYDIPTVNHSRLEGDVRDCSRSEPFVVTEVTVVPVSDL